MRLVFFDDYRLGVVQGDRIVDATAALGDVAAVAPQDRLLALISGWGELRPQIEHAAQSGSARPLAGARLRAPVPRPSKIVCAARNYMENGVHRSVPIEFFLKSSDAVLEPGGTVELPPQQATIFHHEAELAVVIGRVARRVKAADALDYVFGYLPFVDVSARGLYGGFFIGKSFDTFAPLGPAIVTADEVPDPQRLSVALDVNGEARQRFGHGRHGEHDRGADRARLLDHDPAPRRRARDRHQPPGARRAPGRRPGQPAHPSAEGARSGWPALEFSVSDPEKRAWPRGVDEATAERARTPR